MSTKLTDGLNEGQISAYTDITGWLSRRDDHDMWVLQGYAGTGKTFLLGRVIRNALMGHTKWKIGMTAPTNKAVKVLEKMCDVKDTRVSFQTVHRMLGLREKITDDGRQVFERDPFLGTVDIHTYGLVIVDEASMLNDELFKELENYRNHVKFLFVGDPAQIPPVGKDDAIPFDEAARQKWRIKVAHLDEVMRQAAEHPIIARSMVIRNALTRPRPLDTYSTVIKEGRGITYINTNVQEHRESIEPLLKELFNCKEFREDPDHAKVIAWRNATVASFNNIIRGQLYGPGSSKLVIGEKLIADKPIVDPSTGEIIFTTNEEFEVAEYKIKRSIFGPSDDTECELGYYEAVVQRGYGEERVRKVIRILHEDSEIAFKRNSETIRKKALSSKSKRGWRDFYDFIREFAEVNYNYAITAHKAQGSTYKNVVLAEDDIEYNRNTVEKNRIRYTAYTRPTDMLYILKRT